MSQNEEQLIVEPPHDHHNRIIGGTEAPKGRYPYMVNIINSSSKKHVCGGSIISPNVILTAAHCGNPKLVEVGRYDVHADESLEVVEVEVKDVHKHPLYDADRYSNDVALLELMEWIDIERFPPVNLHTDEYQIELEEGQDLTVIGWGLLDYYSPYSRPGALHEVDLSYISNEQCASDYGYPSGWIEDNMLCTWKEDKDACLGDSGGPLVVKGSNETEDVQVGIVSWGYLCAEEMYPGVFSRVGYSNMISWINTMTCLVTGVDYCLDAPSGSPTLPVTSAPTRASSNNPKRSIKRSLAPSLSPTIINNPIDNPVVSQTSRSSESSGSTGLEVTAAVTLPVFALGYIGYRMRRRKRQIKTNFDGNKTNVAIKDKWIFLPPNLSGSSNENGQSEIEMEAVIMKSP